MNSHSYLNLYRGVDGLQSSHAQKMLQNDIRRRSASTIAPDSGSISTYHPTIDHKFPLALQMLMDILHGSYESIMRALLAGCVCAHCSRRIGEREALRVPGGNQG